MLRRSHLLPFFKISDSYRVRVNAIDHDGCFGIQGMDAKAIANYHPFILELLNADQSHQVDYVMTCSNRQSRAIDCHNAILNQNNLALPVARAFAKALNAYFDPLLLSDITIRKKPGFNIAKLQEQARQSQIDLLNGNPSDDDLNKLLNLDDTGFCLSDDKINIIYALMHRVSMQHQEAQITMNIFDDLEDSVLIPLMNFYNHNTSLVPRNINLQFYHYNTAKCEYSHSSDLAPTLLGNLKGEGNTDACYYETVTAMEHIAHSTEGEKNSYHMANYVTPELIKEYLEAEKGINLTGLRQ